MSLTIISAKWANAEHTAVELTTQERGKVLAHVGNVDAWAAFQAWAGAVAAENPPPTADELASGAIDTPDKMDRLWFEVNFDQENRVRTLEGRASVTRAQYRAALINTYKGL
jgi:hypothetical protein